MKRKNFIITIILLVFIFLGGLFLSMRKSLFPEVTPTLPPFEIKKMDISPTQKSEVEKFLTQYLNTYKNARQKKNYEEIRKFFPKSLVDSLSIQALELGVTDFDDYRIEEIFKPAFGPADQYSARVEIFINSSPIKPPTGNTWPISVTTEDGKLKIQTWFFLLPKSNVEPNNSQ